MLCTRDPTDRSWKFRGIVLFVSPEYWGQYRNQCLGAVQNQLVMNAFGFLFLK